MDYNLIPSILTWLLYSSIKTERFTFNITQHRRLPIHHDMIIKNMVSLIALKKGNNTLELKRIRYRNYK